MNDERTMTMNPAESSGRYHAVLIQSYGAVTHLAARERL
jgi:hypothetical protein